MTQTSNLLPTPHIIDNKYCVLEYTSTQRHFLNTRGLFRSVKRLPAAQTVPDDPHAMTISIGIVTRPDGTEENYTVTERVPGVLVQSENFVSGYFDGMVNAFEESGSGCSPLTESEVIATFAEAAANAVMIGAEDAPIEFSTGFLFGYVRGCTLIGSPEFEKWASIDECVAVQPS